MNDMKELYESLQEREKELKKLPESVQTL